MNKEEKELLLMDLCARLPYGVFVEYDYGDGVKRVTKFHGNYLYLMMLGKLQWKDFKPYLRPMSSMTEEELNECVCQSGIKDIECPNWQDIPKEKQFGARLNHAIAVFLTDSNNVDWLNAHHFDYRGMIEKGLALPAKDGMYSPPIWAFVPTGGR